ncbi:MAG: triose-phosphate isomerase [Alphaproteobacteria bacterium]|nr:triose-phosphate isomerase [Alphaproteobacteria bacterium]
MARKKLIAGNWKMNGLTADGVALAKGIATEVKALGKPQCEFLVCPPFTLLSAVKKSLRGAKVALGAQDCHFNVKGAHTGDISPLMLTDLGCSYVILGHSERRADHGESNELVCKKAVAAHQAGLKAVICIGETLEQRDAGKTIDVCTQQILGSVPDNATSANTVIAYEPVWAIGTGKTPTAQDVEDVHAAVRKVLAKKLGKGNANKMRILYGGSVKPSNAKEFLSLPDVDGALIGGASLKVEDFIAIAKNSGC